MAFEPDTGIQRLSEFWISISSAKQRSGRAGRTGPGTCYRLYSQAEYDHFNAFPVPEILRSPLDSIFLQIFAYASLGSLKEFEFLQDPDMKIVHSSLKRLVGVGALIDMRGSNFWNGMSSLDVLVNESNRLKATADRDINEFSFDDTIEESQYLSITPLGRLLVNLPVEVIIGKMLVLATV